MYAVFRSGGKQYRASKGDRLKLERLDADEGARVSFDEVLLVGEGKDIKVGTPLVDGTAVTATVVRQGRTGKVTVTKFRRRQNYLRQHTHRQRFTEVEIIAISGVAGGEEDSDEPSGSKAAATAAGKKKAGKKKAGKKKGKGKKTAKKKAASKGGDDKGGTKKAASKTSGQNDSQDKPAKKKKKKAS